MSDTDSSVDGMILNAAIESEQAGLRLDRALAAILGQLSRSRIAALIEAGAVTLGANTIRDANRRVKLGEIYALRVPEAKPPRPQAQSIPLAVVYEDEDVIVVDKPAGLVVHPAAGNPDGTLVNALIAHCGTDLIGIGGEARPGIVHRLDKNTSGLLVAAKNERSMTSLARQFAKHTIERVYDAVIWGAPRAGEGLIEGEIGRNPFDRKRMAVLRGGGKQARTRYRLVERFGDPRAVASLVECRLETGRTHQIRVHLTHIGHPLIGDPSYGRARQMPRPKTEAEARAFAIAAGFPRQALHARVLGFQHPSLHRTLRFEAPWPGDFRALVEAFRPLKTP